MSLLRRNDNTLIDKLVDSFLPRTIFDINDPHIEIMTESKDYHIKIR